MTQKIKKIFNDNEEGSQKGDKGSQLSDSY